MTDDPYENEDLFGDHERCEDEPWVDADDYEGIEVSVEDYERRRVA